MITERRLQEIEAVYHEDGPGAGSLYIPELIRAVRHLMQKQELNEPLPPVFPCHIEDGD